ncbi:DegV family protein [Bengtsoniella intestinalis]|uniref:DegV family protein n=1 Tax=Bengtsoniella intestinalis TaxID=3073143 RepID=UPI00391F0B01
MTWNIVVDSSSDLLSTADGENVQLTVAPLRILVGEQEFVDNETMDVDALLGAMAKERTASSSACPSLDAFAKAYEKADCSVCFTISNALSGSYNSAVTAREMVLEEYPDKQICVIDSKGTAGTIVLLAQRAKAILEKNPDIDPQDLFAQMRDYQASLRLVFTLECFDNLVKNGRMRPLVGNLLKTLGIHIVAEATLQGEINVTGKARGAVKTYQNMIDHMKTCKDCTGAKVVINHCKNYDGAEKLAKMMEDQLPIAGVELMECRGLTSYYAMEKGIIVGY